MALSEPVVNLGHHPKLQCISTKHVHSSAHVWVGSHVPKNDSFLLLLFVIGSVMVSVDVQPSEVRNSGGLGSHCWKLKLYFYYLEIPCAFCDGRIMVLLGGKLDLLMGLDFMRFGVLRFFYAWVSVARMCFPCNVISHPFAAAEHVGESMQLKCSLTYCVI